MLCFLIAIAINSFKDSTFFNTRMRRYLSEFNLIITAVIISLINFYLPASLDEITTTISWDHTWSPTNDRRSWFLNPIQGVVKSPNMILSSLPIACVVTLLILIENCQTEREMLNPMKKLQKGPAYNYNALLRLLSEIKEFFNFYRILDDVWWPFYGPIFLLISMNFKISRFLP